MAIPTYPSKNPNQVHVHAFAQAWRAMYLDHFNVKVYKCLKLGDEIDIITGEIAK